MGKYSSHMAKRLFTHVWTDKIIHNRLRKSEGDLTPGLRQQQVPGGHHQAGQAWTEPPGQQGS